MSRNSLDLEALHLQPLPPLDGTGKNENGRLLLVAGSSETPGSAVLAAVAAFRAGCGKVTVATVDSLAPHIAMAVPETRVIALASRRDGAIARSAVKHVQEELERFDAVVAGPGMKQGKACEPLASTLLGAGLHRLVLDAALLRVLSDQDEAARSAPPPILLPHALEMAALIGCTEQDVHEDPVECGLECARRYGALVLVKGPKSHVVTPEGATWTYEGGGPGLGVSGSGDVLSGIVGGLLARGASPLAGLLWAVWLHGEAGAALGRTVGPIGFLAREIADQIPALLEKAQPSFR